MRNRSKDVVGDIVERIAKIASVMTEGRVIVHKIQPSDETGEFRAYFENFEIKVVPLRYTNPETIAEGRLGELHFDSQFPGTFLAGKDDFLKVAIEFPSSGMQVWANRIPENGRITTGLAKVMYIYSHSQEISDQGLYREFNGFGFVTNQYLEFIKSTFELDKH